MDAVDIRHLGDYLLNCVIEAPKLKEYAHKNNHWQIMTLAWKLEMGGKLKGVEGELGTRGGEEGRGGSGRKG